MYRYKNKRHIEEAFKRELERFIDKDDQHLLFFIMLMSLIKSLENKYHIRDNDYSSSRYYNNPYAYIIRDLFRIIREWERTNDAKEINHEINDREVYFKLKNYLSIIKKFFPLSFSVYGDLVRRYAAKNDDMLGYRTIVAIQRKVSDERNFDNTICEVSKNFTF